MGKGPAPDAVFVRAADGDAHTIARLRLAIWGTTYRGIYPDEAIDRYDFAWHERRDLERIREPHCRVYLIMNGADPIGYFMFREAPAVHILSLYILREYQRQGIGAKAFALIADYCGEHGVDRYTCNCNAHNARAIRFYQAMGGVVTGRDDRHENKQEDQLTFLFTVPEQRSHNKQ